MRLFFSVSFLLFTLATAGQRIAITGQLRDSAHAPLPSATVLVLNPADSSLVNFGLTNGQGVFEIKNLVRQEYLFRVTYVGMFPVMRKISPAPGQTVVDLGIVALDPEYRQLDEVTVEAERAPVTIKKDTIEFNAGSFKTRENAVVEDLLKKLPGVEVDNDGTIRAQGEQVRRVMVDGKEFFGNDPKIATRNLPADAVDKVQVFDKKSDQAAFSGIDDGQREKTINLSLKEEKRNGAFGTLQGGYGSDDRYQLRGSVNRFKKDQQVSFLGMANNTNEQGFGIDDYMSFTGGARRMAGGGRFRISSDDNTTGMPLNLGGRNSGLMNTYAGGVNFSNDFNKNTTLQSSYFYNGLDHDLRETTERINFRPAGDLRFNQDSRQNNINQNHRLNAVLDHRIDSANSLKLTSTLAYNQTDAHEVSSSESLSPGGEQENVSARTTTSAGASSAFSSTLLWRHRFNKKGRTLSATVQFEKKDNDRDGTQDATTTYYTGTPHTVDLVQSNSQATDNMRYGGSFSYTEPLGNRKYLEANYTFSRNLNDVNRSVYDMSGDEAIFNEDLSNRYSSDYQYHRAGLNFRLNRSSYNVTVGGSVQQTTLEGELKLHDATISNAYRNILPVARFNYDFSDTRHLEFSYETSVEEPTIEQLQPVVDNSDPLNISVGNPDLRPAYNQRWRLHFTTFNPLNFVSFFSFIDATYTMNAITTAQEFTDQEERISMPVNVDNNMRLRADATFSFPVRKIGSRFSISLNGTQVRGVNVIDALETDIVQNAFSGRIRYDFRYQEIFDLSVGANVSRQSTQYEFNNDADQLYFNKTFTAEGNLTFLKNYQLNSSLEYLIYENKTTDYSQSIPFWNVSLSRFILKARSGEIRFSVNNLLDQRAGVSQAADINYFERQTANSLGRYYMVSFIYALNKQLNAARMRPGGGMIRIIR